MNVHHVNFFEKMDESINTQWMIFTFGDMFLQKKHFVILHIMHHSSSGVFI
jgi:hypothetical protein